MRARIFLSILFYGCGSLIENYQNYLQLFFFSCIVKTKSNFKMGKFCNFFSRPIKGEVKNGRGALLPRARTRRSSGQTQRNNKAIDNTQAKAHTFAFYSPFLFLYYNLSSLSLSLSSFHLNCLLFHCCFAGCGACGNVEK